MWNTFDWKFDSFSFFLSYWFGYNFQFVSILFSFNDSNLNIQNTEYTHKNQERDTKKNGFILGFSVNFLIYIRSQTKKNPKKTSKQKKKETRQFDLIMLKCSKKRDNSQIACTYTHTHSVCVTQCRTREKEKKFYAKKKLSNTQTHWRD